jgi:hypothetical protein
MQSVAPPSMTLGTRHGSRRGGVTDGRGSLPLSHSNFRQRCKRQYETLENFLDYSLTLKFLFFCAFTSTFDPFLNIFFPLLRGLCYIQQ